MTENSDNFKKFDQTFKNLNKKYIRGNHDGNLFDKISWWEEYKINEFHFINLDMDMDMDFDKDLLKKNNKIYLTHHVFFNQVFEKISPANYMQNPGPEINDLDFGKIIILYLVIVALINLAILFYMQNLKNILFAQDLQWLG